MAFNIQVTQQAEKDFAKLSKKNQTIMATALRELLGFPDVRNIAKLQASKHGKTFRKRVGQYRIIFVVDEKNDILHVTHIAARKDVYRKLSW